LSPSELAFGNIKAKAKALNVWQFVRNVRLVLEDRIFVECDASFPEWLASNDLFQRDYIANHEALYGVFDLDRHHGQQCFRELARPSLQVCIVEIPGTTYAEMDIDLSSPWMDVYGFLVHMVEVLVPGKTSHRKLRKAFLKDPELRRYLA